MPGWFEALAQAALNLKHEAEIKIKQKPRGGNWDVVKSLEFNDFLKFCHFPDQAI